MIQRFGSWLSLFASVGTLVCCALPSLFVALGMGAALAGLITTFPQLIWLSKYKGLVFTISGLLISLAILIQYKSRNAPCPVDPVKAKACQNSRKWAKIILSLSVFLWVVGFFFAFLASRLST